MLVYQQAVMSYSYNYDIVWSKGVVNFAIDFSRIDTLYSSLRTVKGNWRNLTNYSKVSRPKSSFLFPYPANTIQLQRRELVLWLMIHLYSILWGKLDNVYRSMTRHGARGKCMTCRLFQTSQSAAIAKNCRKIFI